MVGVLTLAYGVAGQEATTIVIVDRVISVFSIIVIGSILYVVSPIRRGSGLSQPDRGAPSGDLTGRCAAGTGTRSSEWTHARTARDRTRPPGAARGTERALSTNG